MVAHRWLDALITASCVAGAIWLLSYLDAHPMPHFSTGGVYDIGLKDVRFYCPPHVAIAIGMFNAKDIPHLYTTLVGTLIAVPVAVMAVQFGEPLLKDDTMLLRAAVVGCATFSMKLGGAVFPPAGAVAVLFLDNAGFKGMGWHYILTPGLTGTLVLLILAAAKIEVTNMLEKGGSVSLFQAPHIQGEGHNPKEKKS